jgi:hypothetical protein
MKSRIGLYNFEEYKVVLDLIFADVLNDESLPRKPYNDCLEKMNIFFIDH